MADKPQKLSREQLAGYLRQAGFKENLIPTMIGIATAESGLNPQALNLDVERGDESYGPFQINMKGRMGPERRELFGIRSNEELFDPLTNAKAAKAIYDQQGLGAWSVYKSGAYEQYVPQMDQIPYTPGNPPPMVPDNAVIYDQTSTDPSKQTRKSVNEILSNLGYDTDQYQKTDDKATSLKDKFTEQLKGAFIMQLLQNPLGGLF
jgi:hypothetical protein